VDAVSNDLMKPLGVDRPEPKAWGIEAPGARSLAPMLPRILGAALAAAIAAASVYVTFAGDPLGGEPYALVPIERVAAGGQDGGPSRQEGGSQERELPAAPEARTRSTASEIEAQSGVSVVRPGGAAAPASVIIQVPDAPTGKLKPAPDHRLVERSRHGLLPRIGIDGARPAKVYARPPDMPAGGAPRVALVVGGLGISPTITAQAVAKLPAAVTLAFSPHGNDLERHVAQAREDGHEVMLQAPMEPFDYPDNDPGPHTLTVGARTQENIAHLHWAMGRFTGHVGVINFMGAKLTAHEAALAPVLREIGSRGLVFVDDGTSSRSLAVQVGAGAGTPTARADLVLDGMPRPDAIDRELERLEQVARQRGFALASASALPVTLDRIAHWAHTLEGRGILLVPASSTFEQEERR
jgi:polysaccharide deacetylase 2 family uncharacterized protein YibQ